MISAGRDVRRSIAIACAGLALLLVAHLGALDNEFHYDDGHSVVRNPRIANLAEPLRLLTDPTTFSERPERAMFRPLVVLSYALTNTIADGTAGSHLRVNLAVHVLCVLLVFALARALSVGRLGALVAALVFGVHPMNAEVVNYVSSRSESFAAAGVLAALVGWLRWRSGKGVAHVGAGWIAFVLGLASKATAIVTPALLLLQVGARNARQHAAWLGLFVATSVGYFMVVGSFAASAIGSPVRPLASQWLTQIKALVYYAKLWLVPHGLTVEHDFAVATGLGDSTVIAAALFVGSVAWIGIRARSRVGLIGLWAVLVLAPASLVPLHVLVNEHRVYLSGALLCVAAAMALPRRRPPVAWVAGGLLLLALTMMSRDRATVWDDDLTLWSEAVDRSPHAYRAHMHLGGALEARGDIVGALDQYRLAVTLQPDHAETHYNLGNALNTLRRRDQARHSWERALEIDPTFFDAVINLSAWHLDGGDWQHAWALLERADRIRPESVEVWRRKGVARRAIGDQEGAERAYRHAVRLDPTNAETHYNLGNLLVDTGRADEAERSYRRALSLNPAHHGAVYNLALLLLRNERPVEAEQVCQQALQLSALRHTPGEIKLYHALGWALDAQQKTAPAIAAYRRFVNAAAAQPAVLRAVQQRIDLLESQR